MQFGSTLIPAALTAALLLLVPGAAFADRKDGEKQRGARWEGRDRDRGREGYYGRGNRGDWPARSESDKEWRKEQKERDKDRREAWREHEKDRREAAREWEKGERESQREWEKDRREAAREARKDGRRGDSRYPRANRLH